MSSPAVDDVLYEVREAGPCTVREIVTNTGLTEARVRSALSALEDAGLVESEGYQRIARVWMVP